MCTLLYAMYKCSICSKKKKKKKLYGIPYTALVEMNGSIAVIQLGEWTKWNKWHSDVQLTVLYDLYA